MNIKQYEETSVRGPEEYKEYKQSILPKRLEDMKPAMSLKQEVERNEYLTKANILNIMLRWLALNVKGRSLTESEQMDLIIDHFITFCSNLELQEVEFVFREGIKGRYGVIFNAIDIDTICGKDGWIELYYKQDRSKRPEQNEVLQISEPKGEVVTERQFLKNNPDIKRQKKVFELQQKIRDKKLTPGKYELKYIFKLLGYTQQNYFAQLAKIKQDFEQSEYRHYTTLKKYGNERIRNIILSIKKE